MLSAATQRGRALAPRAGLGRLQQRPLIEQQRGLSSVVDKIKEFFVFRPNGVTYETYPTDKQTGRKYRYPSPASQSEGVVVPTTESADDVFNIQYYTRDVARNQEPVLVSESDETRRLMISRDDEPRLGSPGNNNPAVMRYDPSGTRSAMSTTWDAMEKELKSHKPTHLPTQWHLLEGIDDLAWTQERGLPPRPGKPANFDGVHKLREGKW